MFDLNFKTTDVSLQWILWWVLSGVLCDLSSSYWA